MCFKIEWRFYGYTKKSSSKQKRKSFINVYSRTNTIFPIPSFLCLHWNWIFHFLFEIIMEYYVILKSLNKGIWKARELTIHWYKKMYFLFIQRLFHFIFIVNFLSIINIFQSFFLLFIFKRQFIIQHTAHTYTQTFYIVMFFNVWKFTQWCSNIKAKTLFILLHHQSWN